MYKLIFPIVIVIAVVLGYQQYSHYQQQSQLALELSNYEKGKQALEKARATKSPQPLEQFIQQYPESDWVDTAIYYRDKYLMQQIVASGDTAKLKEFIKNNRNSEWRTSAQQHLIKIERELENRKIQQRILNNQPEVEITGNIPLLNSTADSPTAEIAETTTPDKTSDRTAQKSNRNESAERVKRALSIYQTMNKPNIAREESRKKQQQEEARRLQACNNMKDQLLIFKNSRRTRWYELDNSGKRVYMSKEAVAKQKREIREKIEEYCQ